MRSPMVPPIADNMSTNFAALSLVTLLIVGVSKNILTYLRSFFHSVLENMYSEAIKNPLQALSVFTFRGCNGFHIAALSIGLF